MTTERDVIATKTHDMRFYEYTNELSAVTASWLSIANIAMMVILIVLMWAMPMRDSYYITTQNGEIKSIGPLSHEQLAQRHLLPVGGSKR